MLGTYSYWLVLLSVLVATWPPMRPSTWRAALRPERTLGKILAARRRLLHGHRHLVDALHRMLAFSLPIPMGIRRAITLLSMLIAIVVSGFALFVVSRATLTARNLLIGGVLMGLGIASMHYTGMAAMQTSPPIQYDPLLFAASIAIAHHGLACRAVDRLTLRTDSVWMIYAKYAAAVVMGIAITGMHYTAMAAAQFAPDTVCLTGPAW